MTVFMREYPGYFPVRSYPGLNITWRIPDDSKSMHASVFRRIIICVFPQTEIVWVKCSIINFSFNYYITQMKPVKDS